MEHIPDHPDIQAAERTGYPRSAGRRMRVPVTDIPEIGKPMRKRGLTMAKYIEREAAISALRLVEVRESSINFAPEMLKELRAIPAADVVPVVRCRDCKHAYMTVDGLCKYCDQLIEYGVEEAIYFPGDYFCADGERKDGDGE